MSVYCCNKFKFFHLAEKTQGMNIRVIKNPTSNKYSFVMTDGYDQFKDAKKAVMNYCPFCGITLKEKYSSEEFVNEEDHIWNN